MEDYNQEFLEIEQYVPTVANLGRHPGARFLNRDNNSRQDNSPSSNSRWEANTSQLSPRDAQNFRQTTRREAELKTAAEMKTCLLEGISKPVESSKAERMMQMMGWQGGALGKAGDGLKEPIAPNLTLQSGQKTGFGHKTEEPEPQQNKLAKRAQEQTRMQHGNSPKKVKQPMSQPKRQMKPTVHLWTLPPPHLAVVSQQSNPNPKPMEKIPYHLREPMEKPILLYSYDCIPVKTNYLDNCNPEWQHKFKKKRKKLGTRQCPIRYQILELLLAFVKDNRAVGMKFSAKISDARRKLIHKIVESLRMKDINLNGCCLLHPTLAAMFKGICESCAYDLLSQSDGVAPLRHIFVYKEAPEHVYLIIKDDLEVYYEKPKNNEQGKAKSVVVPNHAQNKRECNAPAISCDKDVKGIIKQENDGEIEDLSRREKVIDKDENIKLRCDAAVTSCNEDNTFVKQDAAVTSCNEDDKIVKQDNVVTSCNEDNKVIKPGSDEEKTLDVIKDNSCISEVVPVDEPNELTSCNEDDKVVKQDDVVTSCNEDNNVVKQEAAATSFNEDNNFVKQESDVRIFLDVVNDKCFKSKVVSAVEPKLNELTCNAAVTSCDEDFNGLFKQKNGEEKSVLMTTSNYTINVVASNENVTTKSDNEDKSTLFINARIAKQQCPIEPTKATTEIKLETVEVKMANIKQENAPTEESKRDKHIKELLRGYLKEFFVCMEYKEMRFLGEFDKVEQRLINELATNLKEFLDKVVSERNWLIGTVLDFPNYTVQLDETGCGIIMKCEN